MDIGTISPANRKYQAEPEKDPKEPKPGDRALDDHGVVWKILRTLKMKAWCESREERRVCVVTVGYWDRKSGAWRI